MPYMYNNVLTPAFGPLCVSEHIQSRTLPRQAIGRPSDLITLIMFNQSAHWRLLILQYDPTPSQAAFEYPLETRGRVGTELAPNNGHAAALSASLAGLQGGMLKTG